MRWWPAFVIDEETFMIADQTAETILSNNSARSDHIAWFNVAARPMDLTSTSLPSGVFRSCGRPQKVGYREQGPERPNFRVRRDSIAIQRLNAPPHGGSVYLPVFPLSFASRHLSRDRKSTRLN